MEALAMAAALILVGIAGYFSAAETAILAANRMKLRHHAENGDREASLVLRLLSKPDRFLTAVLLGNNLALVAATALLTVTAEGYLGELWGAAAATILTTILLMLFSEILPKSVSLSNADYFARAFAPGLAAWEWAMSPAAKLVNFATGGLFRKFRDRAERLPIVTREELGIILTEKRTESPAAVLERRMIRRIFHFGETTVGRIMIPVAQVVALKEHNTRADVLAAVARTGYSKYPIMDAAGVRVVGVLAARDLLTLSGDVPITPFIRPSLVVKATVSIEYLLPQLSEKTGEVAVVTDDDGKMVGFLTREDIVEEIVGAIEDEHSWGARALVPLARGYAADARLAIGYFNRRMAVPLPAGDYETLGGFLEELRGRVPRTGDEIIWAPYRFRILRATPQATRLVRVEIMEPSREGRI